MSDKIVFGQEEFDHFRDWAELNLESLTWQGKFINEFEKFWNSFFIDGLRLREVSNRFGYVSNEVAIGPLVSWMDWLYQKLICFSFIYKKASIEDLSREGELHLSVVSNILRGFFIDNFPHLDDVFSDCFQIGNLSSKNVKLTYEDLKKELEIDEKQIVGGHEDEILPGLEVTLYPEWNRLILKIDDKLNSRGAGGKKIRKKPSLSSFYTGIRDVSALLVIGVIFVYGVQRGNLWYENHLVDKIKIYEPQFNWLDKTLSFKSLFDSDALNINLNIEDIEAVEENESNFPEIEEEIFETESEVVLTSLDALPKDFDTADLEKSSYEELRKRGYRDSSYGHTKVYRVMMKSPDTVMTKEFLDKMLDEFKVSQVDNVKPGMNVPGGIYYNIYVPRVRLKEFLAKLVQDKGAVLYESRTRTKSNPPGKNKVFIWVKSLH